MSLSSLHDAIDNWALIQIVLFPIEHKGDRARRYPRFGFDKTDQSQQSRFLNLTGHLTSHQWHVEIQDSLAARRHQTIRWLLQARRNLNILTFDDKPNENTPFHLRNPRDGYTKQNGRYGIYVGQTTNTPEHRFEEHMAGINAGNGLQKNGIQLMRSLMWPCRKYGCNAPLLRKHFIGHWRLETQAGLKFRVMPKRLKHGPQSFKNLLKNWLGDKKRLIKWIRK